MKEKKKQMSIELDIKNQCSTSYLLFFKNTFRKFGKRLLIIFVLLFLNFGTNDSLLSENSTNNIYETISNTQYTELVRLRLYNDLLKEVKEYIEYVAPTSKIDPELLVTLCQKYDISISFVLAQGILESHLGTKGKAAITHSVFNVGTYDNGHIIYFYKHPNESIEPFLELIKNDYLSDKKQISDLLKDCGYKNLNGKRYATSPYYETRLRTIMIHIDMHSSINMYQDIINLSDEKIMAYFGPIDEQISNSNLQANI